MPQKINPNEIIIKHSDFIKLFLVKIRKKTAAALKHKKIRGIFILPLIRPKMISRSVMQVPMFAPSTTASAELNFILSALAILTVEAVTTDEL
jgi:hypothetical protein